MQIQAQKDHFCTSQGEKRVKLQLYKIYYSISYVNEIVQNNVPFFFSYTNANILKCFSINFNFFN